MLRLTTPTEFKIYFYLVQRYNKDYGYAFPSLENISNVCDMNIKTVKKCIKSLKEKKLIDVDKFKSQSGQFKNNIYVIWFPIIVEDKREEKKRNDFLRELEENAKRIAEKYKDDEEEIILSNDEEEDIDEK